MRNWEAKEKLGGGEFRKLKWEYEQGKKLPKNRISFSKKEKRGNLNFRVSGIWLIQLLSIDIISYHIIGVYI